MYVFQGTNLQINNKYNPVVEKASIEPLLVIGSGLSAADAIMAARSRGISVLHIFRNSSKDRSGKVDRKKNLDKLRWLPASVYPEYHRVYEMMADKGRNYHFYKSLPDHVVVDFTVSADKYTRTKTRKVTLCTPQGRLISYRVSFAAVFIGRLFHFVKRKFHFLVRSYIKIIYFSAIIIIFLFTSVLQSCSLTRN
jgi:hypothetical protein